MHECHYTMHTTKTAPTATQLSRKWNSTYYNKYIITASSCNFTESKNHISTLQHASDKQHPQYYREIIVMKATRHYKLLHFSS